MGWLLAIVLALVCFIGMVMVLKLPRRAWELCGATLVLGLVGYAIQGSPSQAGSPTQPREQAGAESAAAALKARKAMGDGSTMTDKYLTPADALVRHGQYGEAVELLRGAVAEQPGNGEAWLALANALVGHAEGNLSPASILAFRKAEAAAPGHPGPPFFLGLALAQSGRVEEGRALWAELLARTPPDAPWREELVARLADLDAFIARQKAKGAL
ncbi:MAG: tetratricopeptide repeat protein [Novosphingobium sp.]|jgi:cytochrome c-type biogenesis protein CcmH